MNAGATHSVDVVVIGGGPAGVAAAVHLARDGFSVQVVDPLGVGGALLNAERIDDYPGLAEGTAGWDLAAALTDQLLAAGVELTMGRAGVPVPAPASADPATAPWTVPVDDAGERLACRAVLVATGCRPRPVPGDDGTLEGRGVSYCASCDGGLFAGRPVVVVGDGPVALAEAVSLAPLAATVTVVRGDVAPGAGRAWLHAVAAHGNVTVLGGVTMTGVQLDGAGRVSAVECASAEGPAIVVDAAGVFGALDPVPNSDPVTGLVDLAADGRIPVDPGLAAGPPGLFAAGDVRSGAPLRAVAAAGDGATAAAGIAAYLRATGRSGRQETHRP